MCDHNLLVAVAIFLYLLLAREKTLAINQKFVVALILMAGGILAALLWWLQQRKKASTKEANTFLSQSSMNK